MESQTLWLAALLITFGAAVATMIGFGFAIAIMPAMLLLYPPRVAVPLVLAVSACGSLVQWYRNRQDADYPLVVQLVLGALVGLPLGGFVLQMLAAPMMKAVIGLCALAAILATVGSRGPVRGPRRPGLIPTVGTGLSAGVLATATGQSGLAVSLLMAWAGWEKQRARATLFAYFTAVNTAALPTLMLQGVLAPRILWLALLLSPCYILGMILGEVGFRRLGQEGFRFLMLAMLSLSAVLSLMRGLVALAK
ncbi:MAG: sulfite exporter TauE/SafE family protein [Mycobacterium leprae]